MGVVISDEMLRAAQFDEAEFRIELAIWLYQRINRHPPEFFQAHPWIKNAGGFRERTCSGLAKPVRTWGGGVYSVGR